MPGGGIEYTDLVPLDHEGQAHEGETDYLGCYTGEFSPLNIPNPQPNRRYAHHRPHPQDQIRAKMAGYVPLGPEDPEYAAGILAGPTVSSGLDTYNVYGDLVPMYMPVERAREKERREAEEAARRREGAGAGFFERQSSTEAQYGKADAPVRYDRSGEHRGYFPVTSQGQGPADD